MPGTRLLSASRGEEGAQFAEGARDNGSRRKGGGARDVRSKEGTSGIRISLVPMTTSHQHAA
jgi:hypothetical protein